MDHIYADILSAAGTPMCAELTTTVCPTDGGLNDCLKLHSEQNMDFSILDALDGTYFLVCIFSDIFLNPILLT